jgi:hypothetical protein
MSTHHFARRNPMTVRAQQPPPVPSGSVPVASSTTTARRRQYPPLPRQLLTSIENVLVAVGAERIHLEPGTDPMVVTAELADTARGSVSA